MFAYDESATKWTASEHSSVPIRFDLSVRASRGAALRHRPRVLQLTLLLVLGGLLSSCELITGPPGDDLRPWVTGTLYRQIGDNGLIPLPGPDSESIDAPEIGFPTAKALAEAAARGLTGGSGSGALPGFEGLAAALEREHGGPINFHRLRAAPRAYYAHSAYADGALSNLPPLVRRQVGPYYLIHLMDKHVVAITIAVSGYNSHLQVVDGRLKWPPQERTGGEFRAVGIPRGSGFVLPTSPEAAIRATARALDTRIAAVAGPFVRSRHAAYLAVWRLHLEFPVLLRTQTGEFRDSVVYVGGLAPAGGPRIYVADSSQPAEDTIAWRSPDGTQVTAVLAFREEAAVALLEVVAQN